MTIGIGSRFRTWIVVAALVAAAAMVVGGVGYSLSGQAGDAAVGVITAVTNASGDELIPIPGEPGYYWIDERLFIIVERDLADPEVVIADICELHGCVVVEHNTSHSYRVRFAGHDGVALEELSREIATRPDVESASRDVESPGMSFFSPELPPQPPG